MAAACVFFAQRIPNQPLPPDGDSLNQPEFIVKTGAEVINPFLAGVALTREQAFEAFYNFTKGSYVQPKLDFYEDAIMNAYIRRAPFAVLTRWQQLSKEDRVQLALQLVEDLLNDIPPAAPIGIRTQPGEVYEGPGAPPKA